MDHLQTRLEALQQQMRTVNRRLRWWRALAGGLLVLAVFTWVLPLSSAQEEEAKEQGQKGIAQRVAALEKLLKHFSREGDEVFITEKRAKAGVAFKNTGTEVFVSLRYFGPDVHPNAPEVGSAPRTA